MRLPNGANFTSWIPKWKRFFFTREDVRVFTLSWSDFESKVNFKNQSTWANFKNQSTWVNFMFWRRWANFTSWRRGANFTNWERGANFLDISMHFKINQTLLWHQKQNSNLNQKLFNCIKSASKDKTNLILLNQVGFHRKRHNLSLIAYKRVFKHSFQTSSQSNSFLLLGNLISRAAISIEHWQRNSSNSIKRATKFIKKRAN